jgi:PKD repeat protein
MLTINSVITTTALNWNIAEIPPRLWLSESPISGTVAPEGSAGVVVTFTAPAGAGVYTTSLRVISDNPDRAQVNVPVTLTVQTGPAGPDIQVGPPVLQTVLSESDTATRTLNIGNVGDTPLNWNLAENPNRPWLAQAPVSGTIAPAGSTGVVVTFTAPAGVGVYTTSLRIASNDPDEPQVNVPVTLTVQTGPAEPDIQVGPPVLQAVLGGGDTATKTLNIGNVGAAPLNWNLTENPNRPWLAQAPISGAVAPAGSTGVVVTFTAPAGAGVYTATLQVASNDPDEPQVKVPVTLTVQTGPAGPDIQVGPPVLQAVLGGGNMITRTLTIGNVGNAPLNWNLAENPNRPWLAQAPVSGTVAPAGSTGVVVTFTAPTGAGVYTTSLRVASNDPDEPQVNVPVTLTVQAPDIEVSPAMLTPVLNSGDTATETLTVHNVGTTDLIWKLTEVLTATWLTEVPTNGVVAPSGSDDVVLTFDATSLTADTYTTTLRIISNDPGESQVKVPVTLTVQDFAAPAADFSATPVTGVVPLTVTFTDLSANIPTSWSWSFGDGMTSTLQNPGHTYEAAGVYTVTLIAANDTGSDTEIKPDYIVVGSSTSITPTTSTSSTLDGPEEDLIVDFADPVITSTIEFTITPTVFFTVTWTRETAVRMQVASEVYNCAVIEHAPFERGVDYVLELQPGGKTVAGGDVEPLSFTFTVSEEFERIFLPLVIRNS